MTVTIEKARPEHLEQLIAVINGGAVGARLGKESSDIEVYRRAFLEILEAPEVDIYVALDSAGDVIATYQIQFLKGLSYQGRVRAELESVHTRADMRGKGIGAQMMAHAEALARAADACMVQLTSNREREGAHRFYARLGFAQSHLGFKKMLV
ncbi:MAG: GNAT family N-acetyltransferase [Rhodobacteraceae bacterium]|nr:GNAT family N-acetyltransferase [Paracoccaceae bacterium]